MAHFFIPIPQQAATADITSGTQTLPFGNTFQSGSFQYKAIGFNTADATIRLQGSDVPNPSSDDDWVEITDSTKQIASGNSTDYFVIANAAMLHYRVKFSHGTNSAGQIANYLNFN